MASISILSSLPPDAWGFKPDTPISDRLASLKARALRLTRTNEKLNLRVGELMSENHHLLNRVCQLEPTPVPWQRAQTRRTRRTRDRKGIPPIFPFSSPYSVRLSPTMSASRFAAAAFYHPILARDLAEIERKLSALLASQSLILRTLSRLEARMSTQSDALAALATAEAKLDTDVSTETATLTALVSEVESLKAQLGSTPVDDTATITELTAKIADLDSRIVAAQAAAQGELPAPANPGNPSSGGVATS